MSKMKAFLQPMTEQTKEVIVSKRFIGDDGKVVPFVVRSIPQSENDALQKKATRRFKRSGQWTEELDRIDYRNRLVIAATVTPDFADAEICAAYGVIDPLEVPAKMLLPGEYNKLFNAIADLNGITDDDELEQEIKN